jgi:type I restriction enzyme S subunit
VTSEPTQVNEAAPYVAIAEKQRVPPGYQRTDIGVAPDDWAVSPIATILRNIIDYRGRTPRKLGMAWGDGEIPALSARNVRMGAIDLTQETYYGSEALYQRWMTRGNPKKGDVVVTMEAPLGNVALIPDDQKYILSQRTILLQPAPHAVDAEFLFQLLTSEGFQRVLRDNATGSTATGIQRSRFEKIEVVLPHLPEQRVIAEALSDVDALLGALETLIAKRRAIKQAAMQQLLTGKTRLVGFTEEWKTERLEHVVECLDNLRIPLNEAQRASMPGPYPYCGANGVLDHVNAFVLDDDVILIAEDGGYFDEYAHRPIAYRMSGKMWVNNHAHILKANPGYSQGILYYSLVHKNILPYLASGTRAKLNKSEMNKIEVHLPLDEKEQDTIATILSDMDAEIAALVRRREKARAIKQGMMQQLLTGRVRLAKPPQAAAST